MTESFAPAYGREAVSRNVLPAALAAQEEALSCLVVKRKVPRGSVVPISKRAQNASHSTMCSEREPQHYFRRAPIHRIEAALMCPECETKHTIPMESWVSLVLGARKITEKSQTSTFAQMTRL